MLLELLFLSIFHNALCSKTTFNIAGLFENNQLEEIYRYAIGEVNSEEDTNLKFNLLPMTIYPDKPYFAMGNTCLLLEAGIVGVFGPTSRSNVDSIKSICNIKKVPQILTRWAGRLDSDFQINFYPDIHLLSEAYMDIINDLGWTEYTLLYKNHESLPRLSHFIEIATLSGHILNIENLDRNNDGNYSPVLQELRKNNQHVFMVDCQLEDLHDILTQIQQNGLLTSNYNYFLTNLDVHSENLEPFSHSEAHITGIRLVNPARNLVQNVSNKVHSDTYRRFLNIPAWTLGSEIALIIDSIHMFSNTLKALNISKSPILDCNTSGSWEDGYNIVNTLKSNSYTGLTGLIRFSADGYRSTFELNIFEVSESIKVRGTWNTSHGLDILPDIDNPEGDIIDDDLLRSKHFRVITTLTAPYSMYTQSAEPLSGNERLEGFAIDLIHEMSKIQGFNYTFIVREDGIIGHLDVRHNKWKGMIGDLLDKKADLAISDLTITGERMNVVDFTDPFMHSGISILARKPILSPRGFFYFARPFTSEFWVAIAMASVAVVLSLYIVGRLSPDEWQKTGAKSKYVVSQLTLSNTVWFVAGGLFRQNARVNIRSVPGRIIAASWWVFCFVLIVMYIASLIFHKITEEEVANFTDVESLVSNADGLGIRYGAKDGGSTQNFFRESNNRLYRKIYEYMASHPEDMMRATHDGVERAESTNYAFFMESRSIEFVTNRKCNLAMYGGELNLVGYGIAVRKGSPYLAELSKSILKLQTSGKLAELKRKWWNERYGGHMCDHEPIEEDVRPMSFDEFAGLIYITIYGTVFAALSGILEFSLYTYKLSRKLKTTFFRAFTQEVRRCFSGRIKPIIDPNLLSESTPENKLNEAMELS